jgi:hypothetical protein
MLSLLPERAPPLEPQQLLSVALDAFALGQRGPPRVWNAMLAVVGAGELAKTAPVVSASPPRFTARRTPSWNEVLR